LFGHNILTEGVLVTQLSVSTGISVWRIVRLMTNCCIMTDKAIGFYMLKKEVLLKFNLLKPSGNFTYEQV
jgi:hypothetical protein